MSADLRLVGAAGWFLVGPVLLVGGVSADLRLVGAALGCWFAAIGGLFLPAAAGWSLAGPALLVAVGRAV